MSDGSIKNLGGLYIERFALITPLGNRPEPVYRAIQAGLCAYAHFEHMSHMGSAMSQALVPDDALVPLSDEILAQVKSRRQKRLLQLAATALGALHTEAPLAKMPLLLNTPEKLPGFRTPLDDRFPPMVSEAVDCELDLANSYVLPDGRAGAYQALSLAADLLDQGARQVLVGAVDSHSDERLLALLDKNERILAQGVADGFAPGEAAIFMVLSRNPVPGLRLDAVAQNMEPGHLFNDEPSRGEALAEACFGLLQTTGASAIEHLCGTINGESYYAREWGIAQLRHQSCFSETVAIHHPAENLGDTGASAGLLNLACLHTGSVLGAVKGNCLFTAASELGLRTALLATAS